MANWHKFAPTYQISIWWFGGTSITNYFTFWNEDTATKEEILRRIRSLSETEMLLVGLTKEDTVAYIRPPKIARGRKVTNKYWQGEFF